MFDKKDGAYKSSFGGGGKTTADALFLPNGDVVVCCYGGGCGGKPSTSCQASQFPHKKGTSAGTISYWKRAKAQ